VLIILIFYIAYFKPCYALLDLKKVVICVYFNVTIYIEFELFNYIDLSILSIRFL
jgi:hypothetical protein